MLGKAVLVLCGVLTISQCCYVFPKGTWTQITSVTTTLYVENRNEGPEERLVHCHELENIP